MSNHNTNGEIDVPPVSPPLRTSKTTIDQGNPREIRETIIIDSDQPKRHHIMLAILLLFLAFGWVTCSLMYQNRVLNVLIHEMRRINDSSNYILRDLNSL